MKSLDEKSERYANRLFVAEGSKTVLDLLASNMKAKVIYGKEDWIGSNRNVLSGEPCEVVNSRDLTQMSSLRSTREVVAVFHMAPEQVLPQKFSGIVPVLDGLQDPGNLGTLIRVADWYGIQHLICSADTVDCYNSKVVQATMGSLGRVNMYYVDLPVYLRTNKLPLIGAHMEGEDSRYFSFPKDFLLLIGREGSGIRPDLIKFLWSTINIERKGGAESLNAAVAGAILIDRYFGQLGG